MNDLKYDIDVTRRYFECLYKHVKTDVHGEIEIREKSYQGMRSFFYDDYEGIISKLNESRIQDSDYIFVGINPRMDKGGKKENIHFVNAFYVDLDYGCDGHRQENYYKSKEDVLSKIESFAPEPTMIVHSGHGFHLYWVLHEPIKVDEIGVTRLEGINKALCDELHGDKSNSDLSRTFRMPGTYNRKEENNPILVHIENINDHYYCLDDFYAFEEMFINPNDSTSNGEAIIDSCDISDNTSPPIEHLKQVIEHSNLSDKFKLMIYNGNHDGYDSRSERDMAVVCALLGHRISNEDIINIFNCFPIGDKVREHASPQAYMKKTLEKAQQYIKENPSNLNQIEQQLLIDHVVKEFNQKHALITCGNKVVILEEFYNSSLDKMDIRFLSKGDFVNKYSNQFIEIEENGKKRSMPKTKYWLEHKDRRTYNNLVFLPNQNTNDDYNMWNGFSFEPQKGNCSIYLDHIKNIICNGDENHYDYVIKWMAHAIQKPEEKPGVAIVLKGGRGTGKGMFVQIFASLLSNHYFHISNSKHLTGHFNDHLKNLLLLFADEAFWAGDKQGESVLKTLITEKYLIIEKKGVDAFTIQNYIRLIMASNDDWVVPAGIDERRFFVLEVSEARKQDEEYFDHFYKSMDEHAKAALLYYLMHEVDITGFNPRKYPKTKALIEQKIASMNSVEKFWYDCLYNGTILDEDTDWKATVANKELYQKYTNYCKTIGIRRPDTISKFSKKLNKICDHQIQKDKKTVNNYMGAIRLNAKTFPSLFECRKLFEKYLGTEPGVIDWQEDDRNIDDWFNSMNIGEESEKDNSKCEDMEQIKEERISFNNEEEYLDEDDYYFEDEDEDLDDDEEYDYRVKEHSDF